MNLIGKYAKNNVIISSSSSGLLPTKIYSKCRNPARTMIGHPFNPVYLCPGVEVVAGKKTKIKFLNKKLLITQLIYRLWNLQLAVYNQEWRFDWDLFVVPMKAFHIKLKF